MARGRGGSYEPGVVTITRRRQLSLEPDIEFRDARKAQLISDFANEDADALSFKSRNRDRQLLENITTRLVQSNSPYADNYIVKTPLPPITRQTSVRRVPAPRRLPESALFIRAGSLPPPSRPRIEIYEEDLPPPRRVIPITAHVVTQTRRPIYRAASEPPYAGPRPIYRAASEPRAQYRYPRMTPSSVQAVRNAKRYMDKIERELGIQNGPTIAEPVVIHHVHAAPRVVPRATARVTAARGAAPRYRSSSLPPPPPSYMGVPRSSRVAAIEAKLESEVENYPSVKPESLSALRTRATIVRNKMDQHKSLMDRYLPIHLGPENDVEAEVDYKYGELVNRMPVLDRHRPFQGQVTSAGKPVAPYRVASTYNKPPQGKYGLPPRTSFRPKVSETRKRIREVLCATKKDPHYYD